MKYTGSAASPPRLFPRQAVTDATEQRKGEHKEFVQTAAENNAAVQLLELAKNRMNKCPEREGGRGGAREVK